MRMIPVLTTAIVMLSACGSHHKGSSSTNPAPIPDPNPIPDPYQQLDTELRARFSAATLEHYFIFANPQQPDKAFYYIPKEVGIYGVSKKNIKPLSATITVTSDRITFGGSLDSNGYPEAFSQLYADAYAIDLTPQGAPISHADLVWDLPSDLNGETRDGNFLADNMGFRFQGSWPLTKRAQVEQTLATGGRWDAFMKGTIHWKLAIEGKPTRELQTAVNIRCITSDQNLEIHPSTACQDLYDFD